MELLETRHLLADVPVISEFMADNESGLMDGDGNFSDWVEIHNPTAAAFSLNGWYLSDDRDTPAKWPFPDITLAAGEHLVVIASGQEVDDYVDTSGYHHASFKLSADGEDLLLVEPDGLTYDPTFLDYPSQMADLSYGLSVADVTDRLVRSDSPLSYHVPTSETDVTSWTQVGFDDSQFVELQTVDGAGLLITEIDTAQEKRFVEIQNVSATTIETLGWSVAVNDASGGINSVTNVVWDLPATVGSEQILYRTDDVNDEYWGSSIPWEVEGDGWAMIVDSQGAVRDFVGWGYSSAELATLQVDIGTHTGIELASQWIGDGADVGTAGGVVVDMHTVGPGADITDSNFTVDTPGGERLNVDQSNVVQLDPGTYYVEEFALRVQNHLAGNGGAGTITPMLLSGAPSNYTLLWLGEAFDPTENGIQMLSYAPGSQQFTIDVATSVRAGYFTANRGSDLIALDANNSGSGSSVTSHDNSFSPPSVIGQTVAGFSHSNISRTYAFDVKVNSGLVGTTSLQRTGNVDHDLGDDFVRSPTASPGLQNESAESLFGEVRSTIAGIGMADGDPLLEDFIQTDVSEALDGASSLWTRFEFSSGDLSEADELTLNVRYDDGFQAYLDGVPLASRNAPTPLLAGSSATLERDRNDVLEQEALDVSTALELLTDGSHVLAFHVLNSSLDDPDLLLQPELVVRSAGVPQFFAEATPGAASTENGFNQVADTRFSVDRGFYDTPQTVAITTETSGATIVYTLDGSEPLMNEAGDVLVGSTYTTPIFIDRTTQLRARAYKMGYLPTNVDTQSYFFVEDIIQQTHQSTIDAGFPSNWGGRSANYGLDPDVIGPNDNFGGVYAASIRDDLQAIPTLSLVLDSEDFFGSNGIYANATAHGVAWERPVSAELIYPDGEEGFQVNAGLRVHGGASRSLSRKNSLRLLFKEEYGPTKLDYPLFGDGVDSFDTVVLRAHFNDGWGWSGAGGDPLFSRDMWHRQTQAAMGSVASRGIGVHLYINGLYWGIYNPSERPDASFTAQHLGGDKTEWDAYHHSGGNNPPEVVDGTLDAWNTLLSMASNVSGDETAQWIAYQALQGNDPQGNNDPNQESYLDVENYIDYLLLSFYSGNHDWSGNNWYAARRRGADSEGFQFFAWDSEISMTLSSRTHLHENRLNVSQGVTQAYARLRDYPQFRLAFADRIQKHFAPGGVFYVDPDNPAVDPEHPERNVPGNRFAEVAAAVADSVVAESARWGDQHRSTPYTRDAEWQASLDYMMETYFPQRTGIVMQQFRDFGLFPGTDAALYLIDGQANFGGVVGLGAELTMTNPNGAGVIYYTTDGTDPRDYSPESGAIPAANAVSYDGSPINISGRTTIRSRILSEGEWSALREATFEVNPARAGSLVISELNYNPAAPTPAELVTDPALDNDDFEFIEVMNISDQTIDLTDVAFAPAAPVDFNFSHGAIQTLNPGERALVVANLAAFTARYGADQLDHIAGVFADGGLSNGGERITLQAADGSSIVSFQYDDRLPWPIAADGYGATMVLIEPESNPDHNDPFNWQGSSDIDGNPGAADPVHSEFVVISEVLTHTDVPQVDAIELYNPTSSVVDVGGWYLSDDPGQPDKYSIPFGTQIQPESYWTIFEDDDFDPDNPFPPETFGSVFSLSSTGDEVLLSSGDGTRLTGYSDGFSFNAAENGVSFSRHIDSQGHPHLTLQSGAVTLNAPNNPFLVGDVVITELHYNPRGSEVGEIFVDEFIELRNTTSQPVALFDEQFPNNVWRINGAGFDFPLNTTLAANATALVVSLDPTEFRDKYGVHADVEIFGPFSGSLDNGGERISIQRPDTPDVEFGVPYIDVDVVRYRDNLPWPTNADGQNGDGSSLNRASIVSFGSDPASWTAAEPSPGEFLTALTVHDVAFNAQQSDPPDLPQGTQPSSWQTQRSDIRSIGVTFSEPILATAADLRLVNLGVDASNEADSEIGLLAEQVTVTGATLTIAFGANQLPNGVYSLEILPSVTTLAGEPLDGDGDGVTGDSYLMAGNPQNQFYKLSAEWNGDGGVSIFDFATFSYWFGIGLPQAPEYVDLNADGGVSIFDFAEFSANFAVGIAYPDQIAARGFVPPTDNQSQGGASLTSSERSSIPVADVKVEHAIFAGREHQLKRSKLAAADSRLDGSSELIDELMKRLQREELGLLDGFILDER